MTSNGEKATSFGGVADSYDRVRPAPPAAALDWLVPVGCAVALLARQRSVLLPEGAPFGPGETASFGFSRTMSVDDMLEWLSTRSAFLTASAADRESAFAMTKDALLRQAKTQPGGAGPVVEMPMRS